jgi:hypothetical protein
MGKKRKVSEFRCSCDFALSSSLVIVLPSLRAELGQNLLALTFVDFSGYGRGCRGVPPSRPASYCHLLASLGNSDIAESQATQSLC